MRIWIESAIAIVRIIVGALADREVNGIPSHPATPIAHIVDKPITSSVAKVPVAERSNIKVITSNIAYIKGTSVLISDNAASLKALFVATDPVIATLTSGWLASKSAAN